MKKAGGGECDIPWAVCCAPINSCIGALNAPFFKIYD